MMMLLQCKVVIQINMINRFIKFAIRKDITKRNIKINHNSLVRSMDIVDKVPYLAKYHKKKLIAACVALIIMYTYDFHQTIFRKISAMRSPLTLLQSYFVQEKHIPNTILEQNYRGVDLSQANCKFLMKLYAAADKELYFGVGRYYLFQVYKSLGVILTQEETKKFWIASGFYKQRNQKASGIGLVQFLSIFEEGFKHMQKKNANLTEDQFVREFASKFIQVAPQILKWERQFNIQRNQQFLKNMPGDNQKKKDAIIEIVRQNTLQSKEMLSEQQMEEKIIGMGLKGLNLTDRMLYWELRRTWIMMNIFGIDKKIGHPLTTQMEKMQLNSKRKGLYKSIEQSDEKIKQIETNFESLYQDKIF